MRFKPRLLLIFLSLLGLSLGIVSLFVLVTLKQIPLAEIHSALKTQAVEQSSIKEEHVLEGGSLVRGQELATYLAFSSQPYWANGQQLPSVDRHGVIALEQDYILPTPHKNDCDELYCLQLRRPFREIPSHLWRGLIGIEDIRFLGHVGFDIRAIGRALVRDVISMGFVEGGSTITQQLAKNLFFSNEKSLLRKLKELIIAVAIEARFEKDEIIQAYLNEVYWGVLQGIQVKGFHAASYLYFNKLPAQLTSFEAIVLVSLLKGPHYYNPLRHLNRLRERVEVVVRSLTEKNILNDDIAIWSDKNWEQWSRELKLREAFTSRPLYAWWMSTRFKSGALGSYGKYVFIKAAQEVLVRTKERAPESDLAVKALVRPWHESTSYESFYFYSKTERETEKALTQERHQVGSTLKPLIYAALVQLGADLEAPIETAPIELKLKSGNWSPAESHRVEEEYISLAEALKQSLNRPLIRLAQQIGFDQLEEKLTSHIPHLQLPLREYPAQLLGAVELSVSELAQSYKEFFDHECAPNSSGLLNVLDDPNQTTIKRVVGQVMSQMRFFGKTGTSNGGRDNWFVFFDGKVISAIWVGQETGRQGKELPLYGSSTAFKILESYLLYRGRLFNDLHCVTNENDGI